MSLYIEKGLMMCKSKSGLGLDLDLSLICIENGLDLYILKYDPHSVAGYLFRFVLECQQKRPLDKF